jgi:hypothetical protein
MSKINIKEILEKEGEIRKFVGVSPEGFVLVHEKTLEELKDFDVWRDWKNGLKSIEEMNKLNFQDT